MNETKKTIVTLIIMVAIVMLLPLSLYVKHTNGNKKIGAIKEIYETFDNSLIYISSSNCSFCDMFDPVIDKVSEKYNFKYAYIDILDLTNSQFYELLELLEIDQKDFGTPYLVIGSNGEKISEHSGYMEEEELIDYLKENQFLVKEENSMSADKEEDNSSYLSFINADEYMRLYSQKEKNIIVFGQSTCGACTMAKPILSQIAKEKNIKINYLDFNLIKDNDIDKVVKTFEELGIEEVPTPYIMVVQDKKEIGKIIGLSSETEYINLFKKHDLIK